MPTLSEEETQKHLSSAIQAPGPSSLSGGAESTMSKEELEALEAKRAEKREVCATSPATCFLLVSHVPGSFGGCGIAGDFQSVVAPVLSGARCAAWGRSTALMPS